jgi:prevent-host-death family protein
MSSTITSREFNRDVSAAKRAAENGPVTITDHGRRSHVLLTAKDYDRLTGAGQLVGDRLWARGTEGVELEIPERRVEAPREASL